jgi:hypothetical protein
MFDFEEPGFENLIEHGTGVGRRFHEREIVC